MVLVALDIETVIKGDLLIDLDVAQSLQVNPLTVLNGLAVGLARVIDQARRVPLNVAIQIPLFGQVEYINGRCPGLFVLLELGPRPSFTLLLVDQVADIYFGLSMVH